MVPICSLLFLVSILSQTSIKELHAPVQALSRKKLQQQNVIQQLKILKTNLQLRAINYSPLLIKESKQSTKISPDTFTDLDNSETSPLNTRCIIGKLNHQYISYKREGEYSPPYQSKMKRKRKQDDRRKTDQPPSKANKRNPEDSPRGRRDSQETPEMEVLIILLIEHLKRLLETERQGQQTKEAK
ncbi:unnamed protein product [Ilex paraguariensis]|uniref:Uncharacterized protein n=1 Tax=Ilex paraguariensis TaxID=185542 RepID=A0ABC8T2E9_9AQUA